MREVQIELSKADGVTISPQLDFLLSKIVWDGYYAAKNAGKFDVSIWIFHKDISGIVKDLLIKWFGPDPLQRDK